MTEKQYRLNKWSTRLLKNNRPLFDWVNDSDEIVDLLNDLNYENKQLKKQVEDLEFELRTIKAFDRTVKEDHSDSVYDFQKKLEKW